MATQHLNKNTKGKVCGTNKDKYKQNYYLALFITIINHLES